MITIPSCILHRIAILITLSTKNSIPSNLSPCPCPRHSGETAMAATSPHFSSKKGKRAAQAIIWPSLSTTTKKSNALSSYEHKTRKTFSFYPKLNIITPNSGISSLFLFLSGVNKRIIMDGVMDVNLKEQETTSSSVLRTNVPDSSNGCIICLIPARSVALAILVPS